MRTIVLRSALIAAVLFTVGCSEQASNGLLAPDESWAYMSATAQSGGAVVEFDEAITLFFNFGGVQ